MPLTARDRRTLLIGGGVAAVLLVLTLGLNLIGGGGDEPIPPLASVTGSLEPTPTDGPTTGPPPTDTGSPIVTTTVPPPNIGRDPFSTPPIFSPSPTTTTTSGTGGTTTTTTTTSGTGGTTTTTTTTTSPPGGGNGDSTTIGGHDVVLITVFTLGGEDAVQVEIDGTVYNVTEGESFGPGQNFELRSVSGNCATFVFGDAPFTLCVTPQK
jgi:hypothetical protein